MNWKNLIRWMGIAAVLFLAGCSGAKPAATSLAPGQQAPTDSNIAPPIQVILADGTSVTLEYSTVSKLALQMLEIAGKSEQGPTVPDFLAAAGVTDFAQVTFTGLENRTLTFNRDQLSDSIILALREHPRAVNLMSPNIPTEQWVLHVFKVEVH